MSITKNPTSAQQTSKQVSQEEPTQKRTGRRPKLPGQDCSAEFYHRQKLKQIEQKVRLLDPFISTSECVELLTSLFSDSPNVTTPAEAKTYAKPGKPIRFLVDRYIELLEQSRSSPLEFFRLPNLLGTGAQPELECLMSGLMSGEWLVLFFPELLAPDSTQPTSQPTTQPVSDPTTKPALSPATQAGNQTTGQAATQGETQAKQGKTQGKQNLQVFPEQAYANTLARLQVSQVKHELKQANQVRIAVAKYLHPRFQDSQPLTNLAKQAAFQRLKPNDLKGKFTLSHLEQTLQTLSERDSNTLYYSLPTSSDYAALRQFLALPPAVRYCLLSEADYEQVRAGVLKVYGKHEVVELREFLELDRASMTLFLRNRDASATDSLQLKKAPNSKLESIDLTKDHKGKSNKNEGYAKGKSKSTDKVLIKGKSNSTNKNLLKAKGKNLGKGSERLDKGKPHTAPTQSLRPQAAVKISLFTKLTSEHLKVLYSQPRVPKSFTYPIVVLDTSTWRVEYFGKYRSSASLKFLGATESYQTHAGKVGYADLFAHSVGPAYKLADLDHQYYLRETPLEQQFKVALASDPYTGNAVFRRAVEPDISHTLLMLKTAQEVNALGYVEQVVATSKYPVSNFALAVAHTQKLPVAQNKSANSKGRNKVGKPGKVNKLGKSNPASTDYPTSKSLAYIFPIDTPAVQTYKDQANQIFKSSHSLLDVDIDKKGTVFEVKLAELFAAERVEGTDSYVFSCDPATGAYLNKLARTQAVANADQATATEIAKEPATGVAQDADKEVTQDSNAEVAQAAGTKVDQLTVTHEGQLFEYNHPVTDLAQLDPNKWVRRIAFAPEEKTNLVVIKDFLAPYKIDEGIYEYYTANLRNANRIIRESDGQDFPPDELGINQSDIDKGYFVKGSTYWNVDMMRLYSSLAPEQVFVTNFDCKDFGHDNLDVTGYFGGLNLNDEHDRYCYTNRIAWLSGSGLFMDFDEELEGLSGNPNVSALEQVSVHTALNKIIEKATKKACRRAMKDLKNLP